MDQKVPDDDDEVVTTSRSTSGYGTTSKTGCRNFQNKLVAAEVLAHRARNNSP